MIMIRLDTTGTTSLLTGTTTLDSTVENDEDATTTALVTASTLSTTMSTAQAHADTSQRYIDSLSDAQLIEMEQRLVQKENEISLNMNGEELIIETTKTYKKL